MNTLLKISCTCHCWKTTGIHLSVVSSCVLSTLFIRQHLRYWLKELVFCLFGSFLTCHFLVLTGRNTENNYLCLGAKKKICVDKNVCYTDASKVILGFSKSQNSKE